MNVSGIGSATFEAIEDLITVGDEDAPDNSSGPLPPIMPFDHFGLIAPIFSNVGYSSLETMLEQADLPIPGRVLDVGGRTGRVANAIREHAGGWSSQTHPRHAAPSGSDSAQACLLELRSATVPERRRAHHDRGCAANVIHQGETAREMYRVLKPGGREDLQ